MLLICDKAFWQAVVNKGQNLMQSTEFLTKWATVSFKEKTLLRVVREVQPSEVGNTSKH
jgi:hypothetical protein